jgi:hypothetical protein
MAMYLHTRGMFFSTDFSVLLPKKIFKESANYVLELNTETIISLPTPDFNCNVDESAQTIDSCLLAGAVDIANLTVGCISKHVR